MDDRVRSPRGPDGTLVDPPSPVGRRRAVLILAVVAVAGAIVIAGMGLGVPALREWMESDPERSVGRLTIVLVVMAAFADLPFVFAGVYFWRLGVRAIEAGRFPPPGVTLLKATPVLTGDAAIRRGRLAQVTALVLFGLGVGMVAALLGLVFVLRS